MKQLIYLLTLLPFLAFTQETEWQHLDPEDDGILGISAHKAYEFLADKKSETVIVAVIDNGLELTHEDLKEVIWVNQDEIAGNGIDDDNNGYVDDIHGWNFLGNAEGKNLKRETTGLTRMYALLNLKYAGESESKVATENLVEFKQYQTVKKEYLARVQQKKEDIAYNELILKHLIESDRVITKFLKKSDYSEKEVRKIKKKKAEIVQAKNFLIQVYDNKTDRKGIEKTISNLKQDLATRLNPECKNRTQLVGDNPDDLSDTNYGNNMLNVKGPYHGTGVASIVGASHNDIGADGVAKNVELMILRAVPNGDERDKDIALAFRYAVQNGADIICCSFAKKYSIHPEFVQQAVSEAEEAGVLIVQGAGNFGSDNDETPYYPNGLNIDQKKASNYLTIGASRQGDDKDVAAYFSNYGEKTVDIFAPGFDIKYCALHNGYSQGSGTSMAAPVVAGIAAVIKSYYPYLNGREIKEIILRSAYVPKTTEVVSPGKDGKEFTQFEELSVSGGIANLYRAVLLIEKEYRQ